MKKPLLLAAFAGSALAWSAHAGKPRSEEPDTGTQILKAIVEGVERSNGITREGGSEVLVAKGSERHLVGTTSMDETIVGTCFDADLRPIAGRLSGEPKGRDADETAISTAFILTNEDKKLKASLFHLFNIGLSEQREKTFLVVSHGVTTKKWRAPGFQPLDSAPPDAAYCAIEATEGRVVDVLYSSAQTLTGAELSGFSLKGSGALEALSKQFNMTYEVKARGYKQKEDTLPNYSSLSEVLAAVTPGAPFIWDVQLIATRDVVKTFTEKSVKKESSFVLADGYRQQIPLPAGGLRIDVVASAEVTVAFSPGSDCRPQGKATQHSISCTSTQPLTMTIDNPAFMGLGLGPATVKLTTISKTRE